MSNKWTRRQAGDPFVKKRNLEGHRSRAVFKLEQLNKKDKFIPKASTVIDLGSSPGGWSQCVSKISGPKGKILAVDGRPMSELEGVTFLEGDCGDPNIIKKVEQLIGLRACDLVLSDLAPNITGIKLVDAAAWRNLIEIAMQYVTLFLKPGGNFVGKFFQFEDTEEVISNFKSQFSAVYRRKPMSSRKESREFFIVAKEYRV